MTDTDLFTAGESTDGNQLSNAVTTDTPDVKTNVSVGSLSTMVLPELRALANQAGVKGTSGMRKNELIAAIKEIRGQANGASAAGAPSAEDSGKSDTTSAEAPAAHDTERFDNRGAAPGTTQRLPRRRDRPARTADEADRRGSNTREGTATGEADNRQGAPTGHQDGRAPSKTPVATRAVTSKARAVSSRVATTTVTVVRAGGGAASAIARAAVNGRAKAPTPNCVRTTSSSR